MSAIRRGGIIYAQTCVQIPEELRDAARDKGIGLSSTLTEALENKMKEGSVQDPLVSNTEVLVHRSSADEQVDE